MFDVNRIWYRKQKTLLVMCLVPFSVLYRLLISLRRFFYRVGVLKKHALSVPVVIVGNITVGGTGKTPLLIALVELLQQQGFSPGVISRGYGGKNTVWPQLVTAQSNPILLGDEAVLIAKNTKVPVCVGPDRVAAAKHLLLINPNCNIILSDDGLQHLALKRDVEIVVVDGSRHFGNRLCLPAGPLREPLSRLKSVNMVVVNGSSDPKVLSMQFVVEGIYTVVTQQSVPLSLLRDKKIIAVAGIGNPDRFFNTLHELHLDFKTRVFPDHHSFKPADLVCGEDEIIIMTEKDAVKCAGFSGEQHFYLKGRAVLPERVTDELMSRLSEQKNHHKA